MSENEERDENVDVVYSIAPEMLPAFVRGAMELYGECQMTSEEWLTDTLAEQIASFGALCEEIIEVTYPDEEISFEMDFDFPS